MLSISLIAAAELLVTPVAPGFVVGYHASANGASITEHVPSGETVDAWAKMLTVQRFAGVARKVDANGFLQLMIDGLSSGCPKARVAYRKVTGGIAQMRVDCPLNPTTGKPETFFVKAMPGAADMHVAQVAFRYVPAAKDVAWADAYLAKAILKP